jgi:hypothetical protein
MARSLAALVLLLSDALLAVLVWLAAYKLQNILGRYTVIGWEGFPPRTAMVIGFGHASRYEHHRHQQRLHALPLLSRALGRIENYSGGKSPPKTPANNMPTRTAATATVAAMTHHLVSAFFMLLLSSQRLTYAGP